MKDIIESKNKRKWQRHQSNLETKLNDTHTLITSIVGLKIAENIEEEVINEWSKEQESVLEHFEHMLDELNNNRKLTSERRRSDFEFWMRRTSERLIKEN